MTSTAKLQVVIATCSCGRKFTEVPNGATRMNSGAFFSHWFTCECGSGNIALEKSGRLLSDLEGRNELLASISRSHQRVASEAFQSTKRALDNVRPIRTLPHSETSVSVNGFFEEARKAAGIDSVPGVISTNRATALSLAESGNRLSALVSKCRTDASKSTKIDDARNLIRAIADEAMKASTTIDDLEALQTFLCELSSTISEASRMFSVEVVK